MIIITVQDNMEMNTILLLSSLLSSSYLLDKPYTLTCHLPEVLRTKK